MIEKQQQMMRDYEEELVYNELYKRDLLNKNKQQLAKEADADYKRQERNLVLEQQKLQKSGQLDLEHQLKLKEQQMMKQEYVTDMDKEKLNL